MTRRTIATGPQLRVFAAVAAPKWERPDGARGLSDGWLTLEQIRAAANRSTLVVLRHLNALEALGLVERRSGESLYEWRAKSTPAPAPAAAATPLAPTADNDKPGAPA